MEGLFAHRAPNLPPTALASIFDSLIWCLSGNGIEVERVRSEWLRSTEKERIAVALAMNELLPCQSRDDFAQLAAQIVSRWPEFANRCEELTVAWKQTLGHNSGR